MSHDSSKKWLMTSHTHTIQCIKPQSKDMSFIWQDNYFFTPDLLIVTCVDVKVSIIHMLSRCPLAIPTSNSRTMATV